MNINQIRLFCERNAELVRVKKYDNNLQVIKYHKKVFYKNLWTPELKLMRGLVTTHDWKLVSSPPVKVFNHNEHPDATFGLDEIVNYELKINGFMIAVTMYQGQVIYSTTGTLDSDFIGLAKEKLPSEQSLKSSFDLENFTYVFEIVHEKDPHIIPTNSGHYLLGRIKKDSENITGRFEKWNLNHDFESNSSQTPIIYQDGTQNGYAMSWKSIPFREVISISRWNQHEGFMVWKDGKIIKLKTPFYLSSKFLARKSEEKLRQILLNPTQAREKVDEEFYPLLEHFRRDVNECQEFLAYDEQERLQYIREFFLEQTVPSANGPQSSYYQW